MSPPPQSIWDRISHPEDGLLERKPEGAGEKDFKQTVVAFANSVPEGSEAVLFIGVENKTGKILGCTGIESLQKTITSICNNECYPPVLHRLEARKFEGKDVLAVIVPPSTQKPHFSGHAFRRIGSQNQKADEALYSEFITSRTAVGAVLLQRRGGAVQVKTQGKRLGDPAPLPPTYSEGARYLITACNPHTVTLQKLSSQQNYVEQLENISISYDTNGQLLLLVRPAR